MTYLARTDSFMASLGLPEVYRVGGSVRDEILGRRCKDADYVVRGMELAKLERALKTTHAKVTPLKLRNGRQFGWRLHAKGLGLIEIALPRTDRSTGPLRKDYEVVVDPALPLIEDAKRRDFTFNALYKLLPDGPVTDPTVTGLYDLQHKLVRTTHASSFADDPLRILRALRFVSVLGYDLATNTLAEMHEHANNVTGLTDKGVSGTALDELCKILMGEKCADALRLARDTGVLAALLPELAPMLGFDQNSRYHSLTTDEHTFAALETAAHVDAPLRVRMALLFHDAGKPDSAWVGPDGRTHYYAKDDKRDHEEVSADLWLAAATRLNAPKQLRRDVETLVREHMVSITGKFKATKVRRGRVKFGDALLRDLYLHRLCDLSAKGRIGKQAMERIAAMEQCRRESQTQGVPASVKELAIDGRDLIELGAQGADIGRVLRAVLDEVVCSPTDQTLDREWQLARAKALL